MNSQLNFKKKVTPSSNFKVHIFTPDKPVFTDLNGKRRIIQERVDEVLQEIKSAARHCKFPFIHKEIIGLDADNKPKLIASIVWTRN